MRPNRLIGLVLFAGTLALFWPLGHAGFVNYDDGYYVYENPAVTGGLSLEGLRWAFAGFHGANWHPLTWLSHMTDVELFGLAAGRHHLVNVVLHAINATLLFAFFVRSTGQRWPSALVAALFAVHPLHVESVAWISERKDVLSALFWMLTLHAYRAWVARDGLGRYLGVLALFGLGLLSKPMVVTLPCVLLLLDLWPLSRPSSTWTKLLAEKVPLFVLAGAAGIVTLAAQRSGGAVVGMPALPIGARLANVPTAYGWYLEKTVWPSGLAVLYPHPYLGSGAAPTMARWLPAALGLIAFCAVALAQVSRRPFILVGWLWFLGTLVPVIGLVQVGAQATADRYSYLPQIGLFVVIAWLAAEAAARSAAVRRGVIALCVAWLLACAAVTRTELPHWASARALAARSIAVTRENYVMHFNLALALQEEGDLAGARRNYEEAIRIRPDQAAFHQNLATVLVRLGRPREAMVQYEAAMALAPGEPGAMNNLAWLLATHPDPAVRDARRALRLAERAIRSGGESDPQLLDTLAAAQAESGAYTTAADTALRAAARARALGQADLAEAIDRRVAEYAQGRPHRE